MKFYYLLLLFTFSCLGQNTNSITTNLPPKIKITNDIYESKIQKKMLDKRRDAAFDSFLRKQYGEKNK